MSASSCSHPASWDLYVLGGAHELGGIESLRLGLTDLLRDSVLCRLRVLNRGLDLLSSLLQRRELIPADLDPARGDARSDGRQIFSQELYVQHFSSIRPMS